MTHRVHHLWWCEKDRSTKKDPSWKLIGDDDFQESPRKSYDRKNFPYHIPDWAEDLYRVARAVYLADRYVQRKNTPDAWTRHIHLSIPVTDPERWQQPNARSACHQLLQTLTGDVWHIEFRRMHRRDSIQDPIEGLVAAASEVTLFSGGLDSLSWAATRAVAADSSPLLLVTFTENKLQSVQRQVFRAVERLAAARPLIRVEMNRQLARSTNNEKGKAELSTRSRGLLFMACAIRSAAGHRVPIVHVPENGQVALNPPLSAARSATCSTRSVHPRTLWLLNMLLASIDDSPMPLRVVNPLADMTKGEVCQLARGAGLTASELENTLSCGRPPKRFKALPFVNCGACYPCLVRRSGLLHANGADHSPYRFSELGPPREHAADWRAVQRWLRASYTLVDLLTDTPLPPDVDPEAAFKVISRGRKELARLLPDASAG